MQWIIGRVAFFRYDPCRVTVIHELEAIFRLIFKIT